MTSSEYIKRRKSNKNFINKRFGKLLVLEFLGSKERCKGNSCNYWRCICDCGNYHDVYTAQLTRNLTSCGCRKGGALEEDNAALNNLYAQYRTDAKRRKVCNFLLSKEEFRDFTSSNCYYCGAPPSKIIKAFRKKSKPYIYNGIDKINSNGDYTIENSRPCCRTCNIAKNDMSEKEFFDWIKRLCTFNLNKLTIK